MTIVRRIARALLPGELYTMAARAVKYGCAHGGFKKDFAVFRQMASTPQRLAVRWEDRWPQLFDKTAQTPFDAHFTYHPAWAARILARTKPTVHVDIGSILSFSTILSAFVPVRYFDYRPANVSLSSLSSEQADLLRLPFPDESIGSLSCMHTVAHVGLGRYGDAIDYDGDLKAIAELRRVTAPGGDLLFVTPIGTPRVVFNAHRIYSYAMVITFFEGFELVRFDLVLDGGSYAENATQELADQQRYACGCFWFKKRTLAR